MCQTLPAGRSVGTHPQSELSRHQATRGTQGERIVSGSALPSSPKPVGYINKPRLETISSFWTLRAHRAAFRELGGTRHIPALEPRAHHGHSELLTVRQAEALGDKCLPAVRPGLVVQPKENLTLLPEYFLGLWRHPPTPCPSPGWEGKGLESSVLQGWVGLRGPGLPWQQGRGGYLGKRARGDGLPPRDWVFPRVWGGVYPGLRSPTQLPRPQLPPVTAGLLHPEPRGQLRLEGSVCMKHEGCARLPQTPRAGSEASGAPRSLACLLKDGLQSVLGGWLTTPWSPGSLGPRKPCQLFLASPCSSPTAGSGKQELD